MTSFNLIFCIFCKKCQVYRVWSSTIVKKKKYVSTFRGKFEHRSQISKRVELKDSNTWEMSYLYVLVNNI